MGAPTATVATARLAPNGVEDEVSILSTYPSADAALSASFRHTEPNVATVVGDGGVIEIPDFFRATEATLWVDGERADHVSEDRRGLGYEHQIRAVSADVLAGRRQSETVPLAASLAVQEHLAAVAESVAADGLRVV